MDQGTQLTAQQVEMHPAIFLSQPIQSIPAGFPSPATDYLEEKINLNELLIRHPSATFMIRVEGESMIDAFIPPKAMLVVDRALTAKNNDIVVAAINGEFTVKRLVIKSTRCFLVPANKKYSQIEINTDLDCVIWGVVSKIIIDPKDL